MNVHLLLCQCLEQLDIPPCQNELWGGHGNLNIASHQILCPYQLLKIVDVVKSLFFSNKSLTSSRLRTFSLVKHILDIKGHIVGIKGLVKMCSLLVPMTTPCKIIRTKPKLVFNNLSVRTVWRSFLVACVSGSQCPLLGLTYLGYTFHFHVGLEFETFGNGSTTFNVPHLFPTFSFQYFFAILGKHLQWTTWKFTNVSKWYRCISFPFHNSNPLFWHWEIHTI